MYRPPLNPCPCCYQGDPVRDCTRTPAPTTRRLRRISRPLLDQIDTGGEAQRGDDDWLTDARLGELAARGLREAAGLRRNRTGIGWMAPPPAREESKPAHLDVGRLEHVVSPLLSNV
jgi:hypothetical protein